LQLNNKVTIVAGFDCTVSASLDTIELLSILDQQLIKAQITLNGLLSSQLCVSQLLLGLPHLTLGLRG
jgi:hypothetical protein